jgi:hypothetical protein
MLQAKYVHILLTSSTARPRRNPAWWRFQGCRSTKHPRRKALWGCLCTGAGETAGGATPPVLRSAIVFGLLELVVPQGVRQTSVDSAVRTGCIQQSPPWQHCENRAVEEWFRVVCGCVGRADRHRRTSAELVYVSLIPTSRLVAWLLDKWILKPRTGHQSVDRFPVVGFIFAYARGYSSRVSIMSI